MNRDPYTRALHAASPRGEGAPSSPPIDLSSVHVSSGAGEATPYAYARISNPGWEALERSGQILARQPVAVHPHFGVGEDRDLDALDARVAARSRGARARRKRPPGRKTRAISRARTTM